MDTYENVGGVCGFMRIRLENLYNDSGIRGKFFFPRLKYIYLCLDDDYDPQYIDCFSDKLLSCFNLQKAQAFEYDYS